MKEVQHLKSKSFKKIRISKAKTHLKKEVSELFEKRELLKRRISNLGDLNYDEKEKLDEELNKVEKEIAEVDAEENFKFVKENVKPLVDDTENLNCVKMWQLKKKLCKKKSEVPIAKKDENGKLVTEHSKLKQLYETTY